jgi:GMP synthase-like glutamine amidotransferase
LKALAHCIDVFVLDYGGQFTTHFARNLRRRVHGYCPRNEEICVARQLDARPTAIMWVLIGGFNSDRRSSNTANPSKLAIA